MRIGFTYDLKSEYRALGFDEERIAEFDREDTIDGIAGALESLGHEVVRIGRAPALVSRLAAGERWDLVFNIAEGLEGAARESQVPAILDVYEIPYTFADPLALAICLDKRLAKHVVAAGGVPTAAFGLVARMEDLARIDLPCPLFVKPVAEGTSRGVSARSLIKERSGLAPVVQDLLATYRQPVLVERYLPGREFTVGIVGTGDRAEVVGVLEVSLTGKAEAEGYTYENKQSFEGRVEYKLARDAEAMEAADVALRSYRLLDCRDGGRVDVRSDDRGQPSFIEANPLAGLNPTISDLSILARLAGMEYPELIRRIVESAARRVRSHGSCRTSACAAS